MTISLVTGGAGFIGSHIVDRLLAEGHTVRVVDNFLTGKRANLAQNLDKIELFEMSITDEDALAEAMQGVNLVFHQAALPSVPRSVANPAESHHHNVNGTFTVLNVARQAGVKRVVYAASSSAYGDIEEVDFKHESMTPQPMSPYGVAKLVGEYYMQAFNQVYGIETVALRYFNVFGPRQDPTSEYAAVIPRFATAMLDGQRPIIYGDGEQTRDFTYIENVVTGNMLAATSPKAPGNVINVACGNRISLHDLVNAINNYLGTNIEPYYEPVRSGDIKHSRADISKARELLGYEPVVSFEEGIARTVDWFS